MQMRSKKVPQGGLDYPEETQKELLADLIIEEFCSLKEVVDLHPYWTLSPQTLSKWVAKRRAGKPLRGVGGRQPTLTPESIDSVRQKVADFSELHRRAPVDSETDTIIRAQYKLQQQADGKNDILSDVSNKTCKAIRETYLRAKKQQLQSRWRYLGGLDLLNIVVW